MKQKATNRRANPLLLCPTCGRRALRRVLGDHKMGDGFVAHAVDHLSCSSCGENLFSPAAMAEMRRQKDESRRKHEGADEHAGARNRMRE